MPITSSKDVMRLRERRDTKILQGGGSGAEESKPSPKSQRNSYTRSTLTIQDCGGNALDPTLTPIYFSHAFLVTASPKLLSFSYLTKYIEI